MAKLGGVGSDTLYEGEWLTVRAMRVKRGAPARKWYEALDTSSQGKFHAACATVETTLRSNRPPAGRVAATKTSKVGLWEFRVTLSGGKPPHLRALYLRRGNTLWLANGFTKQKNKLESKDLKLGDSIAGEWLMGRGES